MFFILSKLTAFLLQPSCWVVLLFIFWLRSKNSKVKKRLGIASLISFLFFSNQVITNEVQLATQVNESGIEKGKQYEAGILLGGMSGYDKHLRGRFNAACDRFIQANKLYHQGIIKKIVVSGGSAHILLKQPGEAGFLHEELLAAGVPEKDIIIEDRSRNTFENATFSKKILDSLHLKGPFVLITSAFHLPRALLVFHKVGFDVIPHPSAFMANDYTYDLGNYIMPDVIQFATWGLIIREQIGILMYYLSGKV